MGEFSYLTVVRNGTGSYKDKGSKFLSFAYEVFSEDEAKSKLELLHKEYHDARHHCFAWIIGTDKSQYRASDDGEPNHSAGDPILGQIRSRNLTNVVVIVVRYFGGTKLGVSGLIAAYRAAASEALDNAGILKKEITQSLTLSYEYAYTTEVMRLIKDFDLPLLSQDFESTCVLNTEIKLRDKERFLEKIELLNATGTPIQIKLF